MDATSGHIGNVGELFRKNIRAIVKPGGRTLAERIMEKTLGISNLEIARNFGKYASSVDKIDDIIRKYRNIREWFKTARNIPAELPTRTPAKLLLKDSDVLLLVVIERLGKTHRLARTAFTLDDCLAEIRTITETLLVEKKHEVKRNRILSECSTRLRTLDIAKLNNRLSYRYLFNGQPQHLATTIGGGIWLHHCAYLGQDICTEIHIHNDPKNTGLLSGVSRFFGAESAASLLKRKRSIASVKHIREFLEFTLEKISQDNKANIFIIPYTNPFPSSVIRKRAIWTLGEIPYDAYMQNCESPPSWIFENVATPSFCIPTPSGASGLPEMYTADDNATFWNSLMPDSAAATGNLSGGGLDDDDYDGDMNELAEAVEEVESAKTLLLNVIENPSNKKLLVEEISKHLSLDNTKVESELNNSKTILTDEQHILAGGKRHRNNSKAKRKRNSRKTRRQRK